MDAVQPHRPTGDPSAHVERADDGSSLSVRVVLLTPAQVQNEGMHAGSGSRLARSPLPEGIPDEPDVLSIGATLLTGRYTEIDQLGRHPGYASSSSYAL